MEEIRLLSKDDIDVRVAQTLAGNNKVRVNLLLYKDARVDMKILDELFTPMGWKRTHKLIGDRLYCCVEVYNKEIGQWISKEDVGVESYSDAEKGQASDSFKRACFNWGIGRELYTAPKITIELGENEYTRDQNAKIKVWASFSVKSIGYDTMNRTINSLEIQDKFGNVRFSYGTVAQPQPQSQPSQAVRARRTAKATSPAPEAYQPMSEDMYWKIVEAYAKGKKTKTGGDYKETWVATTHAGVEQIMKFDMDVENWKSVNMPSPVERRIPIEHEDFSPLANQEVY